MDGVRYHLKSGRTADEPYMHTIHEVVDRHLGKYVCEIANVMGRSECGAFLAKTDGASGMVTPWTALLLPMAMLLMKM